jgi:glycosyltransferase involved in cell wall biosynthesis
MKISVVIPARNENDEIEETYKSFLKENVHEILIFDDGSDTPLSEFNFAINVRHEISKGPSVCRNLGGKQSAGDVIVFSDAHVRIDNLHDICDFALKNNVVAIPSMQSLNGSEKLTGYCRDFILKGNSNELIGFNMNNSKPKTHKSYCYGNWGGFFVVPRKVFDSIDGWINHKYWGYNDPSLILKCFFCNIDTILDQNTMYKHKGKVKTGFGYPVKAIQPLLNIFHSYFVIFENDTFQNHWLPILKKEHSWMYQKGMELISSAEVIEEEQRFKQLKLKKDNDFFDIFLNTSKNRTEYFTI